MIFIPIAFLLASLYSFFRGYKQWTSGTTITDRNAQGIPIGEHDSKERMSWFAIGANIFGLILLALAIGSYIIVQGEK